MKRNYGIDLLRMLLMFMVVVLHVLGHGGVLDATPEGTVNNAAAWLPECFAFCAVNGYGLITGYVHYGSKYRLSSIALLWLQTVVYSFGISACLWLLKPEVFSLGELIDACFPIMRNRYWFVTSYAGLFLLMPLLNAAIDNLSRENLSRLLFLGFLVFAFIPSLQTGLEPTLRPSDPFAINNGYSTLWLMLLYLFGACMKKYSWGESLPVRKAFGLYVLMVLISWGSKLALEWLTGRIFGEPRYGNLLISYLSPTMVLAAVFLFLAFRNMALHPRFCQVVAALSPAAFGVYLIHEHPYVRENFIRGRFAQLGEGNPAVLLGGVILSAAVVFCICLMIDWIRHRIFRCLDIKGRLNALEEKFLTSKTET